MVLEELYKSKLQDSVQRHTALAIYEHEDVRNHEPPNYSRLKTIVRHHIDQTMRTCNFRVWNEKVERGPVTKRQKGRKVSVERIVGECCQWKAIGQFSKGDSCSFSHDGTSGNRYGHRQKGQSSSPAPKAQTQTDGRKPSKSSGLRESPSGTGGRIACRNFFTGKCANLSCNYWHPPLCLNNKSESGCKYGGKCRFQHTEVD